MAKGLIIEREFKEFEIFWSRANFSISVAWYDIPSLAKPVPEFVDQ